MRTFLASLFVFVCSLLLSTNTEAQINRANLNGTVTDPSGGSVPNAKVVVAHHYRVGCPPFIARKQASVNEINVSFEGRLEAILPAFQRGQDHRLPYDPAAPIPIQVEQSFVSSLSHLGTETIDSFVLHGPAQRSGLRPGTLRRTGRKSSPRPCRSAAGKRSPAPAQQRCSTLL